MTTDTAYIYETLFAAYRKNSATSHFLLGFAYYGEMYVVDADYELLYAVCKLDKASRNNGFSLRYSATYDKQLMLINHGARKLKDYTEKQFKADCEKAKAEHNYNKGEVFESYIFHMHDQPWHKDNRPFFTHPDIYIDGVGYQIKWERATLCNESTIAKLLRQGQPAPIRGFLFVILYIKS